MIAFADAILLLHLFWILAVLIPIPLIWIGGRRGWTSIRSFKWRVIHLSMMSVVVLELVLGIACPLTVWENKLRLAAHEAPYRGSFIEHWVGRAIFYELPPWVFLLAYLAVELVIIYLFFKYPPRRSPSSAPRPSRPGAGGKSPP